MTCIIVKPLPSDGIEWQGDAAVSVPVDSYDVVKAPSARSVTPASKLSGKCENATVSVDAVTSTLTAKAQKQNAEDSVADAVDRCKRLKTDDTSVEGSSSSCANKAVFPTVDGN